jgi:hypothetical protein
MDADAWTPASRWGTIKGREKDGSMKSCIFRAAVIAVAFATGVAAPGSMAFAQGSQGQGSPGQGAQGAQGAKSPDGKSHGAAPAKPVSGVTVQAPPKRETIPPAKKAALDAQAAKRKRWNAYRDATTPTSAPGAASPGASASAMAGNYPGLHDAASH